MSAMNLGFSAIPILPFENSNHYDYQLSLIENYLHKNFKKLVTCLKNDFRFLTKKVEANIGREYSFKEVDLREEEKEQVFSVRNRKCTTGREALEKKIKLQTV